MGWDIKTLVADEEIIQQIREDLIEYLPDAMERDFGPQPLSKGELIPIESPSALGDYNPRTRELVLTKYNYSGVFRRISACQTGTNVMATALDTMRIILQWASGVIRICPDKIDDFTSGAESRVVNVNDANALAKGWKGYIEANGYVGDLGGGLQGLFTLPFGDYFFSSTVASSTAEVVLNQLQLAIASHESTFADSNLKVLAVPTRIFNLFKSLRLSVSGKSVMEAFTDTNKGWSIIKVPQFDLADNGADVGYMLPWDPEQLALVVDESVRLDAYNQEGNLMIRGKVATALMVAKNPYCGLRLRGL